MTTSARQGVRAIPGLWSPGGEKVDRAVKTEWCARRRPAVRQTAHPDRLLRWLYYTPFCPETNDGT